MYLTLILLNDETERIEKISEHLIPGLKVVGTAARDGEGVLKFGTGIQESNRLLRMSIDADGSIVGCIDEKSNKAMQVLETDGCLWDHFRCVRCTVDVAVRLCAGEEQQDPLSRFLDSLKKGSVDFISNKSGSGDEFAPLVGDSELPEKTSWQDPLLVQAMLRRRAEMSLCSPSLTISNEKENVSWSTGMMDVLCTIPKGVPGSRLAKEYILPAMLEQGLKIQAMANSGRYGPAHHFRAFHFWPVEHIDFPICILYPINDASGASGEQDLAPSRRLVHLAYSFPLDRPVLRTSSALFFESPEAVSDTDAETSGRKGQSKLQDVDQGLGRAANVKGTVHRIQGHYEYYHYLQDNIDDSGWGCAYRSLQTICSWFRLQGYSSRQPPTHREIQTALVKLGDKSKDFIGSKKWIGAIELGYVLDSLYNIQSKIITVSDGCNMSSVAREIGLHFDTQGTPIMIGGGVLAYTLLGIDYNEETGDCAYLILDPHYTGTDNKEKIQNSKWVAWKQVGDKAAAGGDLFVSGAFYNLLCPQCPSEI